MTTAQCETAAQVAALPAEQQRLLEWALGNADAAAFLSLVGRLSQLVDDIADREADPEEASAEVLRLALVELPANPFYRAHEAWFRPIFATSSLIWDASNEWARSERRTTRMYAYVLREIGEQVIVLTALLCGGWDHARKVTRDLHEFYHTTDQESFEDWEAERHG